MTSQAIIPAARPTIEPPMQPALLAFFQVTQRAIGQTADPRMTPMNVCNTSQYTVRGTKKNTDIKPTHGHPDIVEDNTSDTHDKGENDDLTRERLVSEPYLPAEKYIPQHDSCAGSVVLLPPD